MERLDSYCNQYDQLHQGYSHPARHNQHVLFNIHNVRDEPGPSENKQTTSLSACFWRQTRPDDRFPLTGAFGSHPLIEAPEFDFNFRDNPRYSTPVTIPSIKILFPLSSTDGKWRRITFIEIMMMQLFLPSVRGGQCFHGVIQGKPTDGLATGSKAVWRFIGEFGGAPLPVHHCILPGLSQFLFAREGW